MKKEYLQMLNCTECRSDLILISEKIVEGKIQTGSLQCINPLCNKNFVVRNFVPRFVDYGHYAESFGAQWKTFAKTQLDNDQSNDSKLRFNSEIGWNEEDLLGKTVIEFGSGAGRFIDVVSNKGAKLCIGIDITDAVDASQDNLGSRENVFFIQADFFKSPVKDGICDFGYSMGVLHHTPDPEGAFEALIRKLGEDGKAGLSLYDISLYRRPNRNNIKVSMIELLWEINLFRCELFRTITTRLPGKTFLYYCKTIVPILHYLNKVPIIGVIRYLLPSTCYKNKPVSWSMLDTHDTYATKIVHQYRSKDIFQWFMRANLFDIIVHNSRAGWVSLTGSKKKNMDLNYHKYLHQQPGTPGSQIEY
ncbi:MAG: class I SAM-dependent methyltransferase [Bacteroidota bacterium]|nr:class I SAM-dependent methyltransferase [Bacteroidota bacterium]